MQMVQEYSEQKNFFNEFNFCRFFNLDFFNIQGVTDVFISLQLAPTVPVLLYSLRKLYELPWG
jgi:hypothetical protein